MKKEIATYLVENLKEIQKEEIINRLEIPPNDTMGDFSLPCFSFAKALKKNPKTIAEEWKERIEEKKEAFGIEKVEAVNGYLNIFLKRAPFIKATLESMYKPDFGIEKIGIQQTFCMDYSSPNIAKNFHVGHLRTTIIGNSLYKIYEKLGYHVVRINHLGDWGTQFGKLIVAYKRWSSKELVEEKGVEELLRIYIQFGIVAKTNPTLLEEARAWFQKMEQKDEEALTIWKWFKEISLMEYEQIYELLGISFDSYVGESFYSDKVKDVVKELQEKHLLKESDGANIIDLSAYDMPPCLITKSDGSSIYHSRDIAAVLYRKKTYQFDKCIYVTGLEQTLHFKQVFKAMEVMGYDYAEELIHVPYGLVSLNGDKLSSREGNVIFAQDILNEAINRAKKLIEMKNPDLFQKEEVARQVGVGAVIFHDLFHQRIKNISFAWSEILNFEGETGPYIQYTYARANRILAKYKGEKGKDIDFSKITSDTEYVLVKLLGEYEEVIKKAAQQYEPSIIAKYAITVAGAFNKFYHESPILQAKEDVKLARLLLVDLTQKVLKDACQLLGMNCPMEM